MDAISSAAVVVAAEWKIGVEHLQCDGPNCRNRHVEPTKKCGRCRGAFYCSETCERDDWEAQHRHHCVDYAQKAIPYYQGEPIKQVPVAINPNCGCCQKSPPDSVVVLPECQHGYCFKCLKDLERRQHQAGNVPSTSLSCSIACSMCRRISTLELPRNNNEAEQAWMLEPASIVEAILFHRALDFRCNAQRIGATVTEREENLKYALAEIEKIEYRAMGWLDPLQGNNMRIQMRLHMELVLDQGNYDMVETRCRSSLDLIAPSMSGNENADQSAKEYIEQHGIDVTSLGFLDVDALRSTADMILYLAEALQGTNKWQEAVDNYKKITGLKVPQYEALDTDLKWRAHAGQAECLREMGDANGSLTAANQVIAVDRRRAAAHKPLALAYKAMGEMELARTIVNKAVFYEEPWNPENKAANMKLFGDLCAEIRDAEERRQKKEAFLGTWGKVLALVNGSALEEDWTTVRQQSYDIFAEEEGDHELRDEAAHRDETTQRLEASAVSALAVVDNETAPSDAVEDDTDDGLHDALQDETEATVEVLPHGAFRDETEASEAWHRLDRIKLTNEVMNWLKRSDGKDRSQFVKKIERLASVDGPDGRKYMKPLVGCKTKIYETYLEQKAAQRILWTTKGNDLIVWYVAKHKSVSRYLALIDNAESRSDRQLASATTVPDLQESHAAKAAGLDRILLDPLRDVPLKLFALPTEEVQRLTTKQWRPPLHLTLEERSIVEKEGTVLLLGRSGTGKTICICNRIDHDRHLSESDPSFKQVFVARNAAICRYVEQNVGKEYGADEGAATRTFYISLEEFILKCEAGSGVAWPKSKSMDFRRYKRDVISDQRLELDATELWKQFRTFIKGSIDAVKQGRALTREEYMSLGVKQCRLSPEQRKAAYNAYEFYKRYMNSNEMWDDCDRMASLVRSLLADHKKRDELSWHKVYVDEVQDFTQAEIALFFMLCNRGGLFFAGDPAQAVVEGVEFRFEDVRSVAYYLYPGDDRYIPGKPMTVNVNFRSHAGVLKVASSVLELLFGAFPGSAKELPKDKGLFLGPRPSILADVKPNTLVELVEKIDGVVLLTMFDNEVEKLRKLVSNSEVPILSIRDSKGLEFPDIIIVDFFRSLSKEHQKPWRRLLQQKEDDTLPEMETHLKQLYTAVTRCIRRLYFAETEPSDAGAAFVRWCTDKAEPIAIKQDVTNVEKMKKTHDEWVSTGIDYAMNAERTNEIERATFWLEKALGCFELGEDVALARKAEAHLSSVHFRSKLDEHEGTVMDDAERSEIEQEGVEVLEATLQESLKEEAMKVCGFLLPFLDSYARKSLEERLVSRLPTIRY